MSDVAGELLGTLGEYFPPNVARAVFRTALRNGSLNEQAPEEHVQDIVAALEQTLPMYMVDPARRGECVRKMRRLLPTGSLASPPAPSPRPPRPRSTPRGPWPAPSADVETGDRGAVGGGVVRVRTARDVLQACGIARELARQLGLSALDQTKVATATSELARNIVLYVGDGEVRIRAVQTPRPGVQIVAADSGPGIPDVLLVMNARYRSRTGMGMGLQGTKRLMDDFEIDSRVGVGTTIVAKKYAS
jgi:serine/threonine-protein kinase RsbT